MAQYESWKVGEAYNFYYSGSYIKMNGVEVVMGAELKETGGALLDNDKIKDRRKIYFKR